MYDTPSPAELQALQRTYLFSGLEDAHFAQLTASASVVVLEAGQTLFRHGEDARAFFWVKEGLVRLSRVSPQGDEKVIDLIPPGRYFAEAAIFMGQRYPVDAAAQVPSRVIAIDAVTFKAWLAQDAQRCFRLIGGMSARLHRLVNEIDQLTLMKGTDRLMQYLIDCSEPDEKGVTVSVLAAPKQVIASRIGIKPETLSRLFHKLSEAGMIRMDGQKVYILADSVAGLSKDEDA